MTVSEQRARPWGGLSEPHRLSRQPSSLFHALKLSPRRARSPTAGSRLGACVRQGSLSSGKSELDHLNQAAFLLCSPRPVTFGESPSAVSVSSGRFHDPQLEAWARTPPCWPCPSPARFP